MQNSPLQTRRREDDFCEKSRSRQQAGDELTDLRDGVMASAHAPYARAENLVLVLEVVVESKGL